MVADAGAAEGRPGADVSSVVEGTLLWAPSEERRRTARISDYMAWLGRNGGPAAADYDELWRWSVADVEAFWTSLWRYFGLGEPEPPALERGVGAEGARWFPATSLNYVEVVRRQDPDAVAVMAWGEEGAGETVTYGRLLERAGAAAAGLRALGVRPGDRVAAVLPNGIEAVVGFLAAASIGAVWSSCAPEFGAGAMVDRFRQIEPTVLVAVEGYRYRQRAFSLGDRIDALEAALPGLAATVVVPAGGGVRTNGGGRTSGGGRTNGGGRGGGARRLGWDELVATPAPLDVERVDFGHPLWILYSSGTTGLPKPIVHSHGGIVLEHLKALALHSDLGPGSRFFWFTTTGWMMWNFLVGGLLVGATIVCYDGDPMWPDHGALWRMARDAGVTYFGTSAPYLDACRRAGYSPRRDAGPESVRTVGSTGAPLGPEGFAWATTEVRDDVQVASVSGGTDVCTAFIGGCPLLPVRAGELQCRMLGCAVEAYGEDGRPVVGEVGELVVTEPMPSMPIALWGDADGGRLHESYFGAFEGGVWRHGDWVKITPSGGIVVYGRSDATLNRGGVRMGTAEFYGVVEALPCVADALVVDTSALGRDGELILLVVPAGVGAAGAGAGAGVGAGAGAGVGVGTGAGAVAAGLGEDDAAAIRAAIRAQLSPRHVPDRIVAVRALPRTINGKKVEVPLRRILLGTAPGDAVAPGALGDPGALEDVLGALAREGLLP